MAVHTYVIAYDISGHRSRRRVMRCLRQYSFSYQYSLFEVQLAAHEVQSMCEDLAALLAPATDGLLCARLDRHGICTQLGSGMLNPIGNILLVN